MKDRKNESVIKLEPGSRDLRSLEDEVVLDMAENDDDGAMAELVGRNLFKSPDSAEEDKRDPDYDVALKWAVKLFEKSGDRRGADSLVAACRAGDVLEWDGMREVLGLFESFVSETDHEIWTLLAYCFTHGKWVEKNYKKAAHCFQMMFECEEKHKIMPGAVRYRTPLIATSNNKVYARFYSEPCRQLLSLYREGGYGLDRDYGKAVELLKYWMDLDVNSIKRQSHFYEMGELYLEGGDGLDVNIEQAIHCFENAQLTNDHADPIRNPRSRFTNPFSSSREDIPLTEEQKLSRRAQQKLGMIYATGKLGEPDWEKAVTYFEKAARASPTNSAIVDSHAEAELGVCLYQLGNVEDAKKCFENSSEKGDVLGGILLAFMMDADREQLREEMIKNGCHDPEEDRLQSWSDSMSFMDKYPPKSDEEKERREKERKYNEQYTKIKQRINHTLRNTAFNMAQYVVMTSEPDIWWGHESLVVSEYDLKMLDVFSELVSFLEDWESNEIGSPSKLILALYHRGKGNNNGYINYLEQASEKNDIIANFLLGMHFKDIDSYYSIQSFLKVTAACKRNSNESDTYYPSKFGMQLKHESEKCLDSFGEGAQQLPGYLKLRDAINEGCNSCIALLNEEGNDNRILFNGYLGSEKKDVEEMQQFLRYLSDILLLPLRNKSDLGRRYNLFVREMAFYWDKAENPPKDNRARTMYYILKSTRNWSSHDRIFLSQDDEDVAFLFLINMRAMFELEPGLLPYEEKLFSFFQNVIPEQEVLTTPKMGIENRCRDVTQQIYDEWSEIKNQKIRGQEKGKSTEYFNFMVNELFQMKSDNVNYKWFIQKLYQFFWCIYGSWRVEIIDDKVKVQGNTDYLKNLCDNKFMDTLARHIYYKSFEEPVQKSTEADCL